MTNFQSARASWVARALVRSGGPTAAPSDYAATRIVEGVEGENWLGYESIHPMTWVPGRAAVRKQVESEVPIGV